MNKAFVRESDGGLEDEGDEDLQPEAAEGPVRNYITPAGFAAMRAELLNLLDRERPSVVQIVSWAASNGDRSENGDYLYGKKRLREIDRRIRFLTRRIDVAEVVDSSVHAGSDQIFFGANVTYEDAEGVARTVRIVGVDEYDPLKGQISWISPVARALLRAREGETVTLSTPQGRTELTVLEVSYPAA